MPDDVIMPALGMAQETGLLLRWLKAPGEAVTAGEALFEVETDKTTMEVEAQASGFLSEISAEAGQEVPVGQTIAVIAASQGAIRAKMVDSASVAPDAVAVAVPEPAVTPPTVAVSPPVATAPRNGVLASPKARRLAAEAGLNLKLLIEAGHPQPYHAADIPRLQALAVPAAAPAVPAAGPAAAAEAAGHIAARIPRAGMDAFVHRMQAEAGVTIAPSALCAAFAAAALREAREHPGDLVVELVALTGPARPLLNPDRARLSAQSEAQQMPPDLILRDLTGSPLTALRLAPPAVPVLSLADDGDCLLLTLDFVTLMLDAPAAIALVTGLAARMSDPLINLV